MGPWRTLPLAAPTDAEIVWVRLNYWFGAPFLAQWSTSAQTFTDTTSGDSIVYPAWTISRWASQ